MKLKHEPSLMYLYSKKMEYFTIPLIQYTVQHNLQHDGSLSSMHPAPEHDGLPCSCTNSQQFHPVTKKSLFTLYTCDGDLHGPQVKTGTIIPYPGRPLQQPPPPSISKQRCPVIYQYVRNLKMNAKIYLIILLPIEGINSLFIITKISTTFVRKME